jgi:hypothetical protein
VEEIVLWGRTWEGRGPAKASVSGYVSFLQSIPHIHTLTLCGIDLNMILQAVEIASDKEDASVPEPPPTNAISTTGEQVVGSRKYFQQVRSLSMLSETPPRIFLTAVYAWMVSALLSLSCVTTITPIIQVNMDLNLSETSMLAPCIATALDIFGDP